MLHYIYVEKVNHIYTDNLSIPNWSDLELQRDRSAAYPLYLWATTEDRIHFRKYTPRQEECTSSLHISDSIWETSRQQVSARPSAETTACAYESHY